MLKWLPVIVICSVLMGSSAYWFFTRPYDAVRMVEMLPPDRSVHVYIDVGMLRSAGVLDMIAGAPSLEELDYKKFISETGFDYRKDLDALAIAFREGDVYYAARGRFTWDKLAAYAPAHQGKCERFLCTTPGSEPGRNVSYYMPRSDVLAIATSRTATAGDMVAPGSWQNPPHIPSVGVWVSAPSGAFVDLNKAPPGTRVFLSPLAQATGTIFTLGAAPSGDGFQLRLEVAAKDAGDAAKLQQQFTKFTQELAKGTQPDPKDLSGILTAGKFETKDSTMTGTWPVPRAFVESFSVELGNKKK
jgi:hypothetical protein